MEDKEPYGRYGWQSSLAEFSHSEPRVVRLQLQQFVEDASPEQIRAWDQSIPWLQRECRELEVRDTAAHEYTAILENELKERMDEEIEKARKVPVGRREEKIFHRMAKDAIIEDVENRYPLRFHRVVKNIKPII